MENYNSIVILLSTAGFFLAPAAGIIYLMRKKSAKHLWIFGCMMFFFLFTAVRHTSFSIAYDDPADPSYAAYMNWTLDRLMLSDGYWLVIWSGIGMLHYLAFVKKNKWIRRTLIFGAAILFFILVLCVVSSLSFA